MISYIISAQVNIFYYYIYFKLIGECEQLQIIFFLT